MIIPIRSETDVKKLPYLTIGLIVLNLVIWIFTNRVVSLQNRALTEIRYEMFKIEYKYSEIITRDPSFIKKIEASPESFFKEMMNQNDFDLWNALHVQYQNLWKTTFFYQWGFHPNHFNPFKILTSMFIHANFFHVFFNMLFMWIVGCNIEDEWTRKTFIFFYSVCGFTAAALHTLMNSGSDAPCIGASGAIAGVMGAFMIRHFKTKIRFVYYFLPFKPFFGTFSIVAGIWLPIWLAEQFVGAKWSSATGTAYWAHIGGFVFGSIVGLSSKAFDSIKLPEISTSAEKLKLTPEKLMDLNKAMLDGQSGAVIGHLSQIKQALLDNPEDVTPRLILARLYFEKGRIREAGAMFNRAIHILSKKNALDGFQPLYQEVQEKNLFMFLSENTLIRLAMYFEKKFNYLEAVKLYNLFINFYPNSSIRPKVLHRTALILKIRLKNETAAEKALLHLKSEYPAYNESVKTFQFS